MWGKRVVRSSLLVLVLMVFSRSLERFFPFLVFLQPQIKNRHTFVVLPVSLFFSDFKCAKMCKNSYVFLQRQEAIEKTKARKKLWE
jgi:hypothetical protein